MRLTDLVTPLKPLEAMAQGKLVVASDVGGHRELIEDGATGTLFAPDDPAAIAAALAGLLGRRDLLDDRRRTARLFVETHRNWSSNILRYEPVYQQPLAHRAPSLAASASPRSGAKWTTTSKPGRTHRAGSLSATSVPG